MVLIKDLLKNVLAVAVYKSKTYARRRRKASEAVDPVDNFMSERVNKAKERAMKVTHKSTDRSPGVRLSCIKDAHLKPLR